MAWEESKHPRDNSGQFTSKGNEEQGGKDKKKDIKSKVNDYFENYAFNDDADIDEVNAMLEDIEKELPFKNQQEHDKWLDIVSTGTGEEIEEFTKEIANRKMDDDFDNDYDFESWDDDISDEDVMQEIADGDYYYGGLGEQEIYNLAAERLNITPERAKQALKNQGFDYQEYQNYINGEEFDEEENQDIDYDTVEYPKGTSKEYSTVVNNKYKNALPILEEAGIKLSDFGGKPSAEGGFEDNTKEIMEKYVFEPFRKKYPKGNNDAWEKEYQPLYDAIESVTDKNYNDWYIKNKK